MTKIKHAETDIYGATLRFLQEALDVFLQADFTWYWLGLNDIASENTWVWDHSGTPLNSFNNWGQGYPDNENNEDCASMVCSVLALMSS